LSFSLLYDTLPKEEKRGGRKEGGGGGGIRRGKGGEIKRFDSLVLLLLSLDRGGERKREETA